MNLKVDIVGFVSYIKGIKDEIIDEFNVKTKNVILS